MNIGFVVCTGYQGWSEPGPSLAQRSTQPIVLFLLLLTLTLLRQIDANWVGGLIIFVVAYACLIPLAVYRLANKASRSTTIIRPAIFLLVRITIYSIRATKANGNYTIGLFIAEQILLLAGFSIICEAIHSLLEYHISRTHMSPKQGQITQKSVRLLRLALLVALAICIAAGTQYNSALIDPSKIDALRTLRNVNGALCLAIVLGVIIVAAIAQVHKNLPVAPTALLIFLSVCLSICATYRLAMIHVTSDPLAASTKAKFYILLSLMEWIVTGGLFADLAVEKKKAAKRAARGEVDPSISGLEEKDPYARV